MNPVTTRGSVSLGVMMEGNTPMSALDEEQVNALVWISDGVENANTGRKR
jgi:hypothetical protein